jgi:tetratricopeptide (TPR) repeat protein
MKEEAFEKGFFGWVSFAAFVVTLAWCWFLGAGNMERMSLAVATFSASFAGGSVIGFVFTIFGEELEPFGKIRDAMIALASGLAGVTIANLRLLKGLIGGIQLFSDRSDRSSWFAVLFVATYFVGGFYFMYLMRKLVVNPALAKSRIEMERIQLSGKASIVAAEVEKTLRPSLLLGRDYIGEDVLGDGGKQADELRSELYSSAVEQFLASCDDDVAAGSPISPDSVAKAAVLHYYRIYLVKDKEARARQEDKAIEWITRAVLRDPLDPALQIKLADIYGMQERYDEAVSILNRLERDESSPQYVQQWLGYFLLFVDGRERDAIRHSLAFHDRFPSEADGLFNAACGYAQLYGLEVRDGIGKEFSASENRTMSLRLLEQAIRIDSANRATARKHSEIGSSFESLSEDEEFLRITKEA